MNDKFKKQLKEAILEVLLITLNEQGPPIEGGAAKSYKGPKSIVKDLPREAPGKILRGPSPKAPTIKGGGAAALIGLAGEIGSRLGTSLEKKVVGDWEPNAEDMEKVKDLPKVDWSKFGMEDPRSYQEKMRKQKITAPEAPKPASKLMPTTTTSSKPSTIAAPAARPIPKPQPQTKNQQRSPRKLPKLGLPDIGKSEINPSEAPPMWSKKTTKKIGKTKVGPAKDIKSRTTYK